METPFCKERIVACGSGLDSVTLTRTSPGRARKDEKVSRATVAQPFRQSEGRYRTTLALDLL
jgi:hypothetical protein